MLGRWLQAKGRDRFVVAIQCRIRVETGPNDARAACEAAWWTLPRRHEPR